MDYKELSKPFAGLPSTGSTPSDIARIVNNMLAGGLNVSGKVDDSGGALTSPLLVKDPRVGLLSVVLLAPVSPITGLVVSSYGVGEFTLTWTAGSPTEIRYVVFS